MNKNSIITILVALVGLMTMGIIVREIRCSGPTQPPPPPPPSGQTNKQDIVGGKTKTVGGTEKNKASGGNTNTDDKVAPPKRSVERHPLEPEATKRLHEGPAVISSVFEASGKGEHASYGNTVRGSYLYTTTVIAQSEVKEKNEDKTTGKIRVVERRKFLQARDNLSLSNIDFALALDTLPVDQVGTWVDNVCNLVGGTCAIVTSVAPVTAPYMAIAGGGVTAFKVAVASAFATLHKIDGTSARGLLGAFGVKVPGNLERFVNERLSQWTKKQFSEARQKLQSIEGKSFLIIYTQEASGKPLNVDYENEDGKPITDTEWEILRTANVFLDSNTVPDTRCRVGDAWTIWADEVQELFGAAGDGRAEGKIRVERVADQSDGNWTLRLEPAEILFRTNDGTAAGKMNIKDGNGLVDAKNVSVKSLHATASGNLRSINKKRHALFFVFVKRIEGNSNLRFTLSVAPAEEPSSK